ncbi:hypothetical protein [Desulfovibrio sp. JC022]|uniref:hypothetical protein n=1 Tax=Desulfovibrio sp. JC022 TaxID=2593642 RepID=UPI0013D727B6|nr:hypothetical protein [Desulfovibrio sp. JC022]NDV23218.1 hypothetical protein [Desulfovibrio sp. JC022]
MAIRWPVTHYSEGKVISHVQLLDYVFAALAEDENLLENLQPNISISNNKKFAPQIIVREGVPLENWEKLTFDDRSSQLKRTIELYLDKNMILKAKQAAKMLAEQEVSSPFPPYYLSIIAERENDSQAFVANMLKAYGLADEENSQTEWGIRFVEACALSGNWSLLQEGYGRFTKEVESYLDWKMRYLAYKKEGNRSIFQWIDSLIAQGDAEQKKELLLKKLILLLGSGEWADAELVARQLLEQGVNDDVVYVVLSNCLEQQQKLNDALQVLTARISESKAPYLVNQLGYLAIRLKLMHTELAEVKALARVYVANLKEKFAEHLPFDEKWYVSRYKPLLGGTTPIDHYLQNSISMVLSPNDRFDTTYYYMNFPKLFLQEQYGALHFYMFRQYERDIPKGRCVIDDGFLVNIDWKE